MKPSQSQNLQSEQSILDIFSVDSPIAQSPLDAIKTLFNQIEGYGLLMSDEGEIWGEFGTQTPKSDQRNSDSQPRRLEDLFAPTTAIDLHFYLQQTLTGNSVQRCELRLDESQTYNCRFQAITFQDSQKAVLMFAEKSSYLSDENLDKNNNVTAQTAAQSFIEAIENENRYCVNFGIHSTLAYIDIDDFDMISERYGPQIASEVLSQITIRLESQTRKEDVVAHIKDDEFALIFRAMGNNVAEAIDESANIAAKIKQMISAPLLIDGEIIQITASIGISVLPQKEKSAEAILADASSGMSQRSSHSKAYLTTFG